MALIDKGLELPYGLSLDGQVGIWPFDGDPSAVGVGLPVGSLIVSTNGKIYQKTGAADTDWTEDVNGLGGTSVVFGSYNQNAFSEPETITTSTVPVCKVLLDTPLLPVGRYRMEWAYEANAIDRGTILRATVDLNYGETLHDSGYAPVIENEYTAFSGFAYKDFAVATTHHLELCFRSDKAGKAVGMRRARLGIWRLNDA